MLDMVTAQGAVNAIYNKQGITQIKVGILMLL